MIVNAIRIIASFSVATCVAITIYCCANGIRSIDDFRNYRVMRSVSSPVVEALADGLLAVGSTRQQLLEIDTPSWTEDYGRCKIHGFTPERDYDRQTVVTVDDRVVSAHVGSCTWQWSFFDEMPEDVAESVGSVRGLRYAIELVPEHAGILQPILDAELKSLGVQSAASAQESEP
ncbi:MAG TPA: hypothetical protein DDX19_06785 [Rhodopirellula baltica]|nr:hypothetical protein [Rhodopirellula baltica]HBE62439.1 hypothetical protein [Rhodopirellula baltica]